MRCSLWTLRAYATWAWREALVTELLLLFVFSLTGYMLITGVGARVEPPPWVPLLIFIILVGLGIRAAGTALMSAGSACMRTLIDSGWDCSRG